MSDDAKKELEALERQAELLRLRQEEFKRGLPHLYGWDWYQWAWDFFKSKNPMNLLCAANQISKALDNDMLIPTPLGFRRMGDLQAGDEVFGRDGLPTRIIATPFRGRATCYRLTFDDGSSVIASDAHRWICKTSRERFRREYTPSARSKKGVQPNPCFDAWVELSTEEILESGGYAPMAPSPWRRLSIPVANAVQHAHKELFDPYLVGLLLGDGGFTSRAVIFTSADEELSQYVMSSYNAVRTGPHGYRLNGLQEKMRELGLMGLGSLEKHIPRAYLQGSRQERLLLLRGLMDTDGTISKSAISFTTISPQLKDDFIELVTSLGGKAYVKRREAGYRDKNGDYIRCNDCYTVRINILDCPFALTRKAERFFVSSRRHERVLYLIEPVGEREATCITVDNADGTFLCTRDYIVTHNSSTQIRKCVEWAGNPKLWSELWSSSPRQFWYLYPDQATINNEWKTKWVDFMPAGKWKSHETYGWSVIVEKGDIKGIEFASGVIVLFKSYSQNVKNLQSGTVYAIFCFPAGTLVLTPGGARPIEALRVGDEVIAGDGTRQRVKKTMLRDAEIITRRFSDGKIVSATRGHPFWVKDRGWVDFGDLTPGDQCGTVPGWKLIESLYYLKASFSRVCRRAKTHVCEIISAIGAGSISTSLFGNPCMGGRSLGGMSSITKITTPSTIDPKILSYSREPSTLRSISSKSGERAAFTNMIASAAGSISSREAPRDPFLGFARKSVGVLLRCVSASFAALLSRLARINRPCFVLEDAPIEGSQAKVYNLEVEGPHTYFADGILVHNCDEELPEEHYSELNARLIATRGYFHMVFTATLNQDFWKLAIEGAGELEKFPEAFKQQVSMRDCITYRNGKPGAFTEERIKEIERGCKSEAERRRRVDGRFITEAGRKYPQYDALRHLKPAFDVPVEWKRYAAVDVGGGGQGHPPAIAFVAVRPDHRFGVVYKGWKGDDGPDYTAGDTFHKFLSLRGNELCVLQKYDQQAKDFLTIATRAGESFVPSDKSHERGEDVINTLFKNDMLVIFATPELEKLSSELTSLMKLEPKRRAKDDLCDAMRYAVVDIPWDWSAIKGEPTEDEKRLKESRPLTDAERVALEIRERRGEFEEEGASQDPWGELERDFAEWNDAYGS